MQGLKVELFLALLRHRPEVGSHRGFGKRLRVVVVVLLPLIEGRHVYRRNDPRIEPHAAQTPADEMGAQTGFHPDHASRQLVERGVQREPLDMLAQNN